MSAPCFRPCDQVRARAPLPVDAQGGAVPAGAAVTVTAYHTGDGEPWRVRVRWEGREVWTWEWALVGAQGVLEMEA